MAYKSSPYAERQLSSYRKGLDLQREFFKKANIENDFETMIKCLENLKCEIKNKCIKKGNTDVIIRLEKIISWYYQIPEKYTRLTEKGKTIKLPVNIERTIRKNLLIGYQLIVGQLEILDLI